ncbi:uncharacterized protein LOC129581232 isoform X2 [Paramacrobiotus metropolitanus]|uniref:uncharacterized protein LOC129581232 isoform X2 n=1 Tax=Paramacrobiotus metropolitanus TaxID=2943436 RepID=UPI002446307E|nr:uncharacterized protein LOC129581232 isoform X2 [Paramacrobiotus metropolitanus]
MDDESEESLPSEDPPASCSGYQRLKLWNYFEKGTRKHCTSNHPEAFCCACKAVGIVEALRGERLAMMRHVKKCPYMSASVKTDLQCDACDTSAQKKPKMEAKKLSSSMRLPMPTSVKCDEYAALPVNDDEMQGSGEYSDDGPMDPEYKSNTVLWTHFRKGPGKYRGQHHSVAYCVACHEHTGEWEPLRRERDRLMIHVRRCPYLTHEARLDLTNEDQMRRSSKKRTYSTIKLKAPVKVAENNDVLPPDTGPVSVESTSSASTVATTLPSAVPKVKALDLDVIKACISAGIPFSALSDNHVVHLFKTLNSTALLPSVSDLMGEVLASVVLETKKDTVNLLVDQECVTLHVRMWNDSRSRFVTGFVASVRVGSIADSFLLSVSEPVSQDAAAQGLTQEIMHAVELLQQEHGATVASIVLSSLCINIHRAVHEQISSFIVLPLYSQHFDKLTRDALQLLQFQRWLDKVVLLQECLHRSKSTAELFRKIQLIFDPSAEEVPTPVGQRWNSYVQCFSSIVENKDALQDFSRSEDSELPIELQLLMEDETFWSSLENLQHVLLPLTNAQRSIQRDNLFICDLLIQLQILHKAFANVSDMLVRTALLNNLETFWKNHCDQKLLIIACALNIETRLSIFTANTIKWTKIGSWALKLYEQVFHCQPDALLPSIGAYRDEEEPFNQSTIRQWKAQGQIYYWKYVKEIHPELAKLAIFLLRITPSAVAVETVWKDAERTCPDLTSREKLIQIARTKVKLMKDERKAKKQGSTENVDLKEADVVGCQDAVANYMENIKSDVPEEGWFGESSRVASLKELFA